MKRATVKEFQALQSEGTDESMLNLFLDIEGNKPDEVPMDVLASCVAAAKQFFRADAGAATGAE